MGEKKSISPQDVLAENARLQDALRKERQENAHLRKQLLQKETLLTELGTRIRDLENIQADKEWRKNLHNVSFKRCSRSEKKIIEALHDIQLRAPHTKDGDVHVHLKELIEETGMCKRTIQNLLDVCEEKQLISRRYEENGEAGKESRNALFIKVEEGIMHNPFHIHKIVPVERQERRGGLRQRKETKLCSNCDSPRPSGYRHDTYICPDCEQTVDDRYIIKNGDILTGDEENAPGSADAAAEPLVATKVPEPKHDHTIIIPKKGKHPRGISCPDCGTPASWVPILAEWGGEIYICAACAEKKEELWQ